MDGRFHVQGGSLVSPVDPFNSLTTEVGKTGVVSMDFPRARH